jgi:hypothetical protein
MVAGSRERGLSACLFIALLYGLSVLFGLRVIGQAVQRWMPQSWLPAADAFQGSGLPHELLLLSQIAILVLMLDATWRLQHFRRAMAPRTRRWIAGFGRFYLAGSLGRIAIGLSCSAAPAWFSTWIPAAFHVVLATFVLTLAHSHRRLSEPRS